MCATKTNIPLILPHCSTSVHVQDKTIDQNSPRDYHNHTNTKTYSMCMHHIYKQKQNKNRCIWVIYTACMNCGFTNELFNDKPFIIPLLIFSMIVQICPCCTVCSGTYLFQTCGDQK